MADGLDLKGLKELLQKLGKVRAAQFLTTMVTVAAHEIRARVALYPPADDANRPPGYNGKWYERGYGFRWYEYDGSLGGKKTSKMLGRQWYATVGGFSARIGNRASYAPDVQGRSSQLPVFKRRGWITLEDAADIQVPLTEATLQQTIERLLSE